MTTYRREKNDIFASTTDPETKQLQEIKVASIDGEGNLRMARGQADAHKAAVEAFLEESGDLEDEAPDVVNVEPVEDPLPPVATDGDPKVLAMPPPAVETKVVISDPVEPVATPTPPAVADLPPSAFPKPVEPGDPGLNATGVTLFGDIPPCPRGTPALGDKTPEVVAWWFNYKPEEAVVRYRGRIPMPDFS